MCQTSFGKEKVALQRTIQAKSNGTINQERTLQHKQEMCVFNAELKVKSHKRTFEIEEEIRQKKLLEQRSRYANVSNAMSQISPFQNSGFHSKNSGGDIRNAMVVQNGGTFPNARVATTACVTEVCFKFFDCLCLCLQNIVPNNSLILSTMSFMVFSMMIRICHDNKENFLMERKNLGNRPSRNNGPRRRCFDNHILVSRRIRYQMDGSPVLINFQARNIFSVQRRKILSFHEKICFGKSLPPIQFPLGVQFLRQHGGAVLSPLLLLVTGPTAALEPAPAPGKSADLISWSRSL
jgi:hypothetical protein